MESHVGFAARGLGSRGLGRDHSMCGRRAKGLRGLNARPERSCAQAGHTTGPANGGSRLREQSRPATAYGGRENGRVGGTAEPPARRGGRTDRYRHQQRVGCSTMKLNTEGAWELRPGRAGLGRAGASALALVVASAYVGGTLGLVAFVFFGLAFVLLAIQFAAVAPLVVFDRTGVTVCGLTRRDQGQRVPWTDIRGITLWSHTDGESSVDCLTIDTTTGLSLIQPSVARAATMAQSAPLVDCTLSISDLRAILGGLREQGTPVADVALRDRRATATSDPAEFSSVTVAPRSWRGSPGQPAR